MTIATCFIQEKYAHYVIKTRDIFFSAETTSISDVSKGQFHVWHKPAENHGISIHLDNYPVQNDECSYEDSLQAHFVEGRALCTYITRDIHRDYFREFCKSGFLFRVCLYHSQKNHLFGLLNAVNSFKK